MSSYQDIVALLIPISKSNSSSSNKAHVLFSLPVSPAKSIIPSSQITNLSLHPTVESLLHIVNLDLPSAHFLLRHMQSEPAWEAMYLHGILHRVEGDLDNTRAWYKDVAESDIFRYVWGGDDYPGCDQQGVRSDEGREDMQAVEAMPGDDASTSPALRRSLAFLNELSYAKQAVRASQEPPARLLNISLEEFYRVRTFCENKFGVEAVVDASGVWVSMADKHADLAEKMITGGEGWREF